MDTMGPLECLGQLGQRVQLALQEQMVSQEQMVKTVQQGLQGLGRRVILVLRDKMG
jgi:hypothetical protein